MEASVSTRLPLTATVITQNEEQNIARCLSSLSFCDEIIVVDSGSTDRTLEIAKRFTSQIHIRPWTGYADQKNHATALAKHSWVLSIDADEELSQALSDEIHARLSNVDGESVSAFTLPRKTIHFGRWIRYGGWYPNRLVRLYRKDRGQWQGDELHESWLVAQGDTERLEQPLLHYSFVDLADQVDRNNRYSGLGAAELRRRGRRFSLFALVVRPVWKFIETYGIKMGFRDGIPGFVISVSAGYSVFLKWAKLWEIEVREKKQKR